MRLDSEKRNRKLGLRAEVKLTTFVRTENFQTENSIWSENRLFGFDRLLTSDNFFGRTIPRRL